MHFINVLPWDLGPSWSLRSAPVTLSLCISDVKEDEETGQITTRKPVALSFLLPFRLKTNSLSFTPFGFWDSPLLPGIFQCHVLREWLRKSRVWIESQLVLKDVCLSGALCICWKPIYTQKLFGFLKRPDSLGSRTNLVGEKGHCRSAFLYFVQGPLSSHHIRWIWTRFEWGRQRSEGVRVSDRKRVTCVWLRAVMFGSVYKLFL